MEPRNPSAIDIVDKPFFDPTYLNLEFLFLQIINLLDFFYGTLVSWLLSLSGGDAQALIEMLERIGWILIFILTLGIIRISLRYRALIRDEESEYGKLREQFFAQTESSARNERWNKVLDYLDSHNESDWRLAIIEADSILEEMLEHAGHHGETIGDRLKAIEPSDFLTLDKAWEAHKIRNRIAHEGGGFELSSREAKRAVDLYRQVFEEFHFI